MSCSKCTCEPCQRKKARKQTILTRQAAQAIELRMQGLTLPRIAEIIGSSQSAVCKLLKGAQQ